MKLTHKISNRRSSYFNMYFYDFELFEKYFVKILGWRNKSLLWIRILKQS